MAVLEPTKGGFYIWKYLPSIGAAAIFIVLFLITTALISWRMTKSRTWFCIPFAIGSFFEFAGYCARASAHNKTSRIMPYAAQNIFILLGPALMAASIYMCLSRIIRIVRAEHHSIIKPKNLTRTFVLGDVLSFVVQGGAAGLMVTGDHVKLGEGIVIAGLLIQIIMFALFAFTAWTFQRRIRGRPTPECFNDTVPWQKSMYMLFIVSALIMFRSIFRVIEYSMGWNGYPLTHEWTLYVFDTVPIFFVTVVYYVWYPLWAVPNKFEREMFPVASA